MPRKLILKLFNIFAFHRQMDRKFLLSMGGRSEGQACATLGARTPIGACGISPFSPYFIDYVLSVELKRHWFYMSKY